VRGSYGNTTMPHCTQVMEFCTECASEEGCELDYEMADDIMTELHRSATEVSD